MMVRQPPNPKDEDLVAQLGKSFRNMKTGPPTAYESDEKLIIALDFGTTFSGIAYCFANQRDPKVAAILDWPGAEGESAPKIPTLINYTNAKGGKFAWGASVNRMQGNVVGVKLLLDPSQERPFYLPTSNIKRTIKNLPKVPVEIAADFIGAVYRHAQSEIAKVVPKDYLKICQKHFVLSVPAVWSDAAKNATLQASRIAGIFPVTLIKEPEAAALYTMHSLDFSLNVGDAFVVCDAGGGTVDLISYEVVGLTPNLQVKELVPGTGGMAGSLGLNQRFVEAVKNLVGEDQFADLRKTKGFLLAEKTFDREVKRAFKGDPDEEYFVNFPMASLDDDPDSGLEANCWRMTGKDLKAIFNPLITDILRLIDDQVKSVKMKRPTGGVTGIFLVGGFGSSQYLKACVEREHPGIQVLQPTDAWAAIVKGAALSKLPRQATVLATSATHHYGVTAWKRYDPELDSDVPSLIFRDGSKKAERASTSNITPRPSPPSYSSRFSYFTPSCKKKLTDRQMTWFINIGDDILRDQKIKFPFYQSIDEDYSPSDLIFRNTLFECSDSHAPMHFSKGHKISSNCVLEADLRSVPKSQFVRRIDKDGQPYAQSPQAWKPTSATTELPSYSKSAHPTSPVLIDAELPWRPFYLQHRILLRTEYQNRLVAPWIRLSGRPAQAKHTLLLDYLSDYQLFTVFKAIRNRDFAVSVTSAVAIVIKVLIVISTGLIDLNWTLDHYSSWPATVQDRFIDNPIRLSDAATLSYYVMQGLISQNLTLPEGIATNYAFQSVYADLPDTARAETSVIVDGFGNSLECQPAALTLKGSAPPDPHYSVERHLQIRPSPTWPCAGRHNEPCDVVFTRFTPTRCDGITGDAGRRVLVLFGNMTYSLDFSTTLDDYTGAHTRHPYLSHVRQSAQMLCVPTYGITKVNVVRNGTQTRSVTVSPGATSRTLGSVTGWDLMDAHSNPYGKTRKVGNTSVDVDEFMDFALPTQLAPDQPLDSLLDPSALQRFATGYYAQVAAIIAKQSLMEPASIQTQASVTMWRNRLVIRPWAAHWMAGLTAVCLILTAVAVPTTLPGMASLVRHRAADMKSLSRPLLGSTFNQPYFAILSDLPHSKHTHPGVLHPVFRAALCLFLVMLSTHDKGLGDAGDNFYVQYTWTAVPAVTFGGLSILFSAMDFQIRAKAYQTLDFMDMSVPRAIFREIQFGNIGALAATMAFLVASVFTIFSASLFQALAIPTTIPVSFRANQSFSLAPYDSDDGNVIASLIFGSNFSFPMFTYDDLAFPQLSTISIQAVVPAVRSKLTCRVYDSSKITTNLTLNYTIDLTKYDNPLGINIQGEECNRFPEYESYGYNNILPTYPNMTYFAIGNSASNISQTQGCSDLIYTWGKIDYTANPIIQHITSIGCNETIETLSVATTFLGANLTIDHAHPPSPLPNTTRPSGISTYGFRNAYGDLARLSTTPNYLTPFFAMLTTSPWAIPLPYLGTPTSTPEILAAIHHHHGLIRAQTLAHHLLPANTTNTTLPLDHPVNMNTTDDIPTYPGVAQSAPGEGRRRVIKPKADDDDNEKGVATEVRGECDEVTGRVPLQEHLGA
ncbi:hypothetical protein B0I37DRAFT_399101 [Chaetomium sp. MPI-CAGE-AT-0009]|nr:hypothetical protein B0I37DRAFT_399101 [Chaetomium sp. MPI-CAGE-AT-0009]